MTGFKNIVCCLSLLVCFVAVKPQLCTPGPVINMTYTSVFDLYRLEWTVPTNALQCSISVYVVDIFDLENQTQLFQYITSSDTLYLYPANLDMCKTYTFKVHALSDQHVIGPSERLNGTKVPSTGGDLNLRTNVTLNEDTEISLTWNPIIPEVSNCISYYRVLYWDEVNSPIENFVSANNFILRQTPVPCMEYNFQVSAIVENPDIEGPLANATFYGYPAVPNPPKLVNIITTSTSVNMTWSVPASSENHCQLAALWINTLGAPDNITNVGITIQDSALRPNIDVSLTALTPNTVYTSHVYLQNIVGPSKNVTVTFQTSDSFAFNYKTDLSYED